MLQTLFPAKILRNTLGAKYLAVKCQRARWCNIWGLERERLKMK
jgi:chorismate mutase